MRFKIGKVFAGMKKYYYYLGGNNGYYCFYDGFGGLEGKVVAYLSPQDYHKANFSEDGLAECRGYFTEHIEKINKCALAKDIKKLAGIRPRDMSFSCFEELNLPTYRGKRLNDGKYVIGYLWLHPEWGTIIKYRDDSEGEGSWMMEDNKVDSSTLAIHFPNWIDVNGEKVFASLEKNNSCLVIVNSPFMTPDSSDVECSVFFNGIEFEVRALNRKGLKKNYFFLSNLVGENGSTFGTLKVIGIKQ